MHRNLIRLLALVLVSGFATAQTPSRHESEITPRIFGVGVFSTDAYDITPTFSPDGQTAFFTVSNPSYRRHTLLVSNFRNGKWQTPEVAPFSGQWSDADPFMSHDGSKLYFISNRPITGTTPKRDFDIYVVEKTSTGWGEPKNIGEPINTDASELYVTLTKSGNLYYVTALPSGLGQGDIYRSEFVNGKYSAPQSLGPTVNTNAHDTTPYISPDESYLIFASNRQGGAGAQDLYISYWRDSAWTQATNLGTKINSAGQDYCPLVSQDGKYLFFSSDRGFPLPYDGKKLTYRELVDKFRSVDNGLGNIYHVELSAFMTGKS
jgi:Tol biopolymer transport system component